MAGSFLFHPHYHGSTAAQAGGGTVAFFIIEDEEGSLPPLVANMPEYLALLQYTEPAALRAIQERRTGAPPNNLYVTSGSTDPFLLVNGFVAPVVTINGGQWVRFRFGYNALAHELTMEADNNDQAQCEFQLLAKDGIYLRFMPRLIDTVRFNPGARADVAVRCVGEGRVDLLSRAWSLELDTGDTDIVTMTLNVVASDVAPDPDLDTFTVSRPCYLVDTSLDPVVADLTPFTTMTVATSNGGPDREGSGPLNGQYFTDYTTYLNEGNPFVTGTLAQVSFSDVRVHTYHQHVNSFQLVNIGQGGDDVFYQVGDWQDSVHDLSGTMTARFWVDNYPGRMMVHCHLLPHEDFGMMGIYLVTGDEGQTVDSLARLVDPTCHGVDNVDFVRTFTLGVDETPIFPVVIQPPSGAPTAAPLRGGGGRGGGGRGGG